MKKNNISIFNDLFDENFSLLQFKNDFYNLRTNIKETEKEYVFDINVAGVKKENIDLNIEDNYLIVTVSDNNEVNENESTYLRKEITYKNMKRKYYVGDVKEENIKASLNNGILQIIIPKETKVNKKNIEIK